eukprot:jgi/Mesen1/5057/ME000252S04179
MKEDKCAACSLSDFTDDFGPRCIKESLGLEVEPSVIDDDRDWFCSESCKEVTSGLAKLQGRRQCLSKAERRYTYELAKYRSGDRESSATIAAALKIFKSSFGPLIMDDGADLIENVCKSSSSGELDCGNFRVLVLRDGPTTVTAATIRIFGTEFAEVPFVATKIGCSFTELLNEPMLVDKLPPCPATPALRPMEPHGAQWPASSVLRNTYLTACSIVIEKAMTEFRKQVEASVADFEAESFKKLGKMGGDVDKMECLVKSLQARKMETERERSNMKVKLAGLTLSQEHLTLQHPAGTIRSRVPSEGLAKHFVSEPSKMRIMQVP